MLRCSYKFAHFLEGIGMSCGWMKPSYVCAGKPGGSPLGTPGAGQRAASAFALSMLLAFSLAPDAQAARIIVLDGKLTIQRGDKTLSAVVGSRLRPGDEFISEGNSEALVRFGDGARLAVRPESRLEVTALQLKGARLPPENHQDHQRRAALHLGAGHGQE